MTRRLVAVLSLVLASMLLAPVAMADVKIATVDLQRALNEVEEGATAKRTLKKEFDDKQKQLDAKQAELKSLKDDLDARSGLLKPEVKQEKMADLQKKLLEVQQTYMQMQQELSKREADATAGIFKKMGNILQTMGEESDYTLIVEKNAIVYSKPALDLTNELIRRYNDAYGKKKK